MNTTKQIATTKKVDTRLLAILTALCMVLGIVPIMVSAEEVAYHTQGNELCIYLDTSDEVVTEDSVTEYYYNIIKTPKLADQDMVFKIALGKAPGINNQTAILQNGNVKVYSSNDLKATPFYTVPNNAIVSTAKNDFWPEAGYQAGRNGRTHTITIPANTLSAANLQQRRQERCHTLVPHSNTTTQKLQKNVRMVMKNTGSALTRLAAKCILTRMARMR